MGLKKRLKVGWLLLGNINTGSSRIHGINIHTYLLKNGIDSVILQSSPKMNRRLTLSEAEQENILRSDIDVLVFQKVFDEHAVDFARRARERGKKTIFLLSDKYDTEMVTAVDRLVVTSDYLRLHFAANPDTATTVVIEDALEHIPEAGKQHGEKEELQLIWVGQQENWQTLEIVHEVLTQLNDTGLRLKTISNHHDADRPWTLDTVAEEILSGDVAVIPAFETEWGLAKSNNRLTMFMSYGLPVVASDVPAYRNIIRQGENGFIACSKEQWRTYLQLLKDHRVRQDVGDAARHDAISSYHADIIGKRWVSLLETL